MSTNPQRLDGKAAIITGAGGGIGGATARLFLDLGARVILTDRDAAKLAEAEQRLGAGENLATNVVDSTDEAATQSLVAATVERFGKLDIMIANAGLEGVLKSVDQLALDEFEQVLRVNV